jgi:hypothetical protein
MIEVFAFLDGLLSSWLSPTLSISVWGTLSGALCMGIYVIFAPQDKLRVLKVSQKEVRKQLKAYEGEDFSVVRGLIFQDLRAAMKMIGISIVPFVLSVVPAFWIMTELEPLYTSLAFVSLGADWTASYEFWYITALIVSSLYIKFAFKIE